MIYPFPEETLSLIESVNWLASANRKNDDWIVLQQVALREIFGAARTGNLRAYVLDGGGQAHEADRAQFAALGDQVPMILSLQDFLSTTRRMTNLNPMRMRLLPMDCEYQVRGKLFFFLADLESVFADVLDEPRVAPKSLDDILIGLIQLGVQPGRHKEWPWQRVQSEALKGAGNELAKGFSLRNIQREYKKLATAARRKR